MGPVGSSSVDRELCKKRVCCRKHYPTVPFGQILESNIKTVGGDVDVGHTEQELLWKLGAGAQYPLKGLVCTHFLLTGWTVSSLGAGRQSLACKPS